MNYYNEWDKHAAAWLRELIKAGLIPPGDVDERSICDVQASDLDGYIQCHWFAGIGGWSEALRIAGWPQSRPVWTGSCPCQSFSNAGKRDGAADERHLWPEMYRLIRERRPERIFGEQVEAAIRLGWLDGVSADLEAEGYAVGSIVLGAHSVGAPHIRQRIFWVADASFATGERGTGGLLATQAGIGGAGELDGHCPVGPANGGKDGGLAHAEHERARPGIAGIEGQPGIGRAEFADNGADGGMGEPIPSGSQGHAGHGDDGDQSRRIGAQAAGSVATAGGDSGIPDASGIVGGSGLHESQRGSERRDADRGLDAWSDYTLVPCGDGKSRRIGPGITPLAHGLPARVVRLRGYGNSICPQVAAAFIEACG